MPKLCLVSLSFILSFWLSHLTRNASTDSVPDLARILSEPPRLLQHDECNLWVDEHGVAYCQSDKCPDGDCQRTSYESETKTYFHCTPCTQAGPRCAGEYVVDCDGYGILNCLEKSCTQCHVYRDPLDDRQTCRCVN